MSWKPPEARAIDPRIRLAWLSAALVDGLVVAAAAVALLWWRSELPATALALAGAGSFVVVSAAVIGFNQLRYRHWWFEVRRRELVVGHGVLFRRRSCVPLSRIQHVDLDAGPLLRRLGLQEVSIYTAGSTSAAVEIPGLTLTVSDELRARLLDEEA